MVVLALRTGQQLAHLRWDEDDRLLATAWAVLADEDAKTNRAAGGAQMSG